jgi:hypothetical protein
MHVAELKLKLSAHIFRIRRLVKQLIFRLIRARSQQVSYGPEMIIWPQMTILHLETVPYEMK